MKHEPAEIVEKIGKISSGAQRPGHPNYLHKTQMEQLAIDVLPDIEDMILQATSGNECWEMLQKAVGIFGRIIEQQEITATCETAKQIATLVASVGQYQDYYKLYDE